MAPALLLFGVFVLYPMVSALSYAFFGWQGTTRGAFVGLDNFTTLFTREPFRTQLPRAFGHNIAFFVGTMVIQNTLGLGIAVLLHRRARTRRLLQTLYAMPYLVSPIVIGYLWTLLLSPTFGPVNALLRQVGLGSLAVPWLGDPSTALWVVVLVSAWQWVGLPRPAVRRRARRGARGAVRGRAGRRRGPLADVPLDHVPAAGAGDRHGQRPDLHLRDGGVRAAVRPGWVHREPRRRNGLHVAAVLPDGVRERLDQRHRQLLGDRHPAVRRDLRRCGAGDAGAAPHRGEDRRMSATVLAPRETSTTRILPPPQRRRQRPVGGAVGSAALWIYAIAALTPLVLMVANSFRSTSSLYSEPLSAPWPPEVDSYRRAWTEGHFGEYFLNSLLVTAGAVALSTVVATMAAYALARTRSRIFSVLESVFLSGLMLPIHLAVLPIFYLLDGMRLVDSRLGLMLVYAASGVPFSIFVLTTFFRQLPPELEEAARIDGANAWQMFLRIMVPLVRPAVATVVVFRFVPIWNDFLFPLVLLRTPREVHRARRPDLVLRRVLHRLVRALRRPGHRHGPARRAVPRRHQADRRRADGGHEQVTGARG